MHVSPEFEGNEDSLPGRSVLNVDWADPTGHTVRFAHPLESLTINGSPGRDDIRIDRLDHLFQASLLINGGDVEIDIGQLDARRKDTSRDGVVEGISWWIQQHECIRGFNLQSMIFVLMVFDWS